MKAGNYEADLIKDLTRFTKWSLETAEEISGTELPDIKNFISDKNIPVTIRMALNSLLTGICNKGSTAK